MLKTLDKAQHARRCSRCRADFRATGTMRHWMGTELLCDDCYRAETHTGITFACRHCDRIEECVFDAETNAALIDHRCCLACFTWLEFVGLADTPEVVRVDGGHWTISDDGQTWRVLFHDGRDVAAKLRFNGTIPERFRGLLPDNARFGN